MHALGVLGDIIVLGLIGVSLVGWAYLMLTSLDRVGRLFERLWPKHGSEVGFVLFPFLFFGILYAITKLFGIEALKWTMLGLFVAAPIVGIWVVKFRRF